MCVCVCVCVEPWAALGQAVCIVPHHVGHCDLQRRACIFEEDRMVRFFGTTAFEGKPAAGERLKPESTTSSPNPDQRQTKNDQQKDVKQMVWQKGTQDFGKEQTKQRITQKGNNRGRHKVSNGSLRCCFYISLSLSLSLSRFFCSLCFFAAW